MKIGIITAMSSETETSSATATKTRKNTPKVLSNILKAALEIIPLS